jgi:putative flippase GtrA
VNRRAIEGVADRCVPRFLAPHGEKIQYLVVGAFNTLFGYAVWAVLYDLLSGWLGYAPVLVASYAIAIANAYVLYRFVVFRSHGRVWR